MIPHRETIGQPECPILHRWTLLDAGRFKVMVHHFLPETRDRDYHDHPRPFVTFVLRGEYIDVVPCARCGGTGDEYASPGEMPPCFACGGSGDGEHESMRAGTVRFRPAEHAHATYAGSCGAWTVVVMGPFQREWGFWRGREWLPWRAYEALFGHGFRCGDES